jgi:hypothetical protein
MANRPRQRPTGLKPRFARRLRRLPAPVWALAAGSSVLATEALARLNSRVRLQLVTDQP